MPALQYSLAPISVPCSNSQQELSIVDITLTGLNAGSSAVSPSSIAVTIPAGSWSDDDSLTAQPDAISAAAGSATPWAIAGYAAQWQAFPLPPATSIAPGASISFTFSNVIVNLVESTSVPIAIEESGTAVTPPTLAKTQAVGPFSGTPTVSSFSASPTQVAQGQTVTFTWTTQNANACYLTPGQVPLTPPLQGTLPLSVAATGSYTLTALASGGSATSQPQTVTVMPVAISSFTATPSSVASGQPVTLAWTTQYASSCSIDQGVGPVATSGQATVKPTQSTVYTLTANGLNPKLQEVPVTVT